MRRRLQHQSFCEKMLLLSTAALWLSACGMPSDGTMPDPDNPSDPNMMMMMMDPMPQGTIGLTMGPIKTMPGTERTVCYTGQFSLKQATDFTKIVTKQAASHHVIFYKYKKGSNPATDTEPQNCTPLNLFGGGGLKAPLFIGESSDPAQNVLNLPPGVAYHVEPDDYYMIEMHIVNATPKEIAPTAEVYLEPAPEGSGKLDYADMFFFNNTKGLGKNYDGKQSGLPPMTMTTLDPDFATLRSDFKVFGITTHQHHLGAGISVNKSPSAGQTGMPLFTNPDWSHPPLYRLPDDQPMTFKAGEGLRWTCSYNNTTSSYVRFGESGIDDEMCIIWGYYYPSAGLQIVWH